MSEGDKFTRQIRNLPLREERVNKCVPQGKTGRRRRKPFGPVPDVVSTTGAEGPYMQGDCEALYRGAVGVGARRKGNR